MANWTHVNERLPEIGVDVLAITQIGYMVLRRRHSHMSTTGWEWSDPSILGLVEYWMPLPAPPKDYGVRTF